MLPPANNCKNDISTAAVVTLNPYNTWVFKAFEPRQLKGKTAIFCLNIKKTLQKISGD